jgi:glycosyltransferase involved in cell wall biosynthesis
MPAKIAQPPSYVTFPTYYYTPMCFRPYYDKFLWWSLRRPVAKVLKSFAPDLVLSYWLHPDGDSAIRAAKLAGVPAVVMTGGSDLLILGRRRTMRARILGVLSAANGIITIGAALKCRVLEMGLPSTKVYAFQRGIDSRTFYPGDRAMARARLDLSPSGAIVLWVGRLVEVKGLDVLLDAAALLRKSGVRFTMYLIGDGPLRDRVHRYIGQRSLESIVFLVGSVPNTKLADWYRSANLMVISSHSEGIPNVLLESLACGTPFVATRVGGIPEITDDPEQDLVPPRDPQALALAIQRHLETGDNHAAGRFAPLTADQAAESFSRILVHIVNQR